MNVKLTSDQLSVLLCNVIDERGLQAVLDELADSARACGSSETTAMRIEDCVRGRSDVTPPSRKFLTAVTASEAEFAEKKRAALAELNAAQGTLPDLPDGVGAAINTKPTADIIAFSRPRN